MRGRTIEQGIQQILEEALAEGQNVLIEGKVASYTSEPTKTNSSNLGCCIMDASGNMYKAGNYNIPFTTQSITKAFSLIFALQTSGYDYTFSKVDMEPTGDHFDSTFQLELKDWRPFNPMINAGAIVTADCTAAANPFGGFPTLVRKLCDNPKIQLNEKVYHSEKRTDTGNRSVTYLLKSDHVLDGKPEDVLDVYFRICSAMYMTEGLAHYAMILSNRGVDPKTRERPLDASIVRIVTTLTILCGIYDESGEYAVKIGLPPKSGVDDGIVAVGQSGMGIGTFGPMLNKKRNSMGGERILQYLSERLGYYIFA